jgi:hypothetical protein
MVAERVSPAEYQRYLTDPERPALLQALRTHEIGGRGIDESLDAITAEPLTGLRSVAGGLHGRLEKGPAPARGQTQAWGERAARVTSPEITAASEMMDARQAGLGRQVAERPPLWALEAWGVPPAEGELRAQWERLAGIVASYREAAGVTDPKAAIGPPPSGNAQIREAFLSAAHALALTDDQAAVRAMGRGELETTVDEADRAAAAALPDVQADIAETSAVWQHTAAEADIADGAGDTTAAAEKGALAEGYAGELARLKVADAARREWAEANAGTLEAAREAAAELGRRGIAGRLIPVTDAEVAEAASQERETPPMDPDLWAELKAQQTAEVEAARQARIEASAGACPVTDAEIEKYGGEPRPVELTGVYAEIHEDLQAIGEGIRELSAQMDAEDARREREREEWLQGPPAWKLQAQAQAEAQTAAEASWQPGERGDDHQAETDLEAEI